MITAENKLSIKSATPTAHAYIECDGKAFLLASKIELTLRAGSRADKVELKITYYDDKGGIGADGNLLVHTKTIKCSVFEFAADLEEPLSKTLELS